MPELKYNIADETWKPAIGYKDVYSISSYGRLRREKPEANTFKGRIMRPDFPAGYAQYALTDGGVQKRFKAHQLVARAFIGKCPKGKQVNHKDGDKLNCHFTNLEYVTGLENHRHASRMRLKPFGERSGKAKLTDDAVRFIRSNHTPYHPEFGLLALSKRFNVERTTISSALYRRTWPHID